MLAMGGATPPPRTAGRVQASLCEAVAGPQGHRAGSPSPGKCSLTSQSLSFSSAKRSYDPLRARRRQALAGSNTEGAQCQGHG